MSGQSSFSLCFRGNLVLSLQALEALKALAPTLQVLVLAENPLSEMMEYRLFVLLSLPLLERLDKEPVSSKERDEAKKSIEV